jgi:hypothetical protein
LKNAGVRLGPIEKASGEDGSLVFSGVPEGEYELEVRWLGVLVYSKRIKLSEPARIELNTRVYDVSIEFKTRDGGKVYADYVFRDPAGREFRGELKEGFRIEGVPDGLCSIVIRDHDTGRILYKSDMQAYKLAEVNEIKLPIQDMFLKVSWADGRPVEKARIVAVDVETGEKSEEYTNDNGDAVVKNARYSTYKIVVYYPYTELLVYSSEVGFSGQKITITLREAVVTVKVLDALGSPVKGAEVSVSYMGTLLGRGFTDPSGIVELRVLEKPSYKVSVRYGMHRAEANVEPNKHIEVKMDVARILGLEVSIGEFSPLIYVIVGVAVSIIILIMVLRIAQKVRGRIGE